MMQLSHAKVNEEHRIAEIIGKDTTKQHLHELGFIVGELVYIISITHNKMVVSVKGTRIAIHKDLTDRVLVPFKGKNVRTLNKFAEGTKVKIVDVHSHAQIKNRFMSMGLTVGAEIYVQKIAPLGDPIDLVVRGCHVSIRRTDAEEIEVIPIKE